MQKLSSIVSEKQSKPQEAKTKTDQSHEVHSTEPDAIKEIDPDTKSHESIEKNS